MNNAYLFLLIALGALLLVASPANAHEENESDHHNEDHMAGWTTWPSLGMGMLLYWVLAIPVGLLILTDADERGMNGAGWFLLVMIPLFGLVAVMAFLLARRERPRVYKHDPWAEGDRLMDDLRQQSGMR
jgi:hypothetical protein